MTSADEAGELAMAQGVSADPPPDPSESQLEAVLHLVSTTTARLLGDTIALSDDEWRAPSRLPGWSRAHVASHVARQADALVRVAGWATSGERAAMYASSQHRDAEIEAGAGRPGLELQIDLDTSAERLTEAFDAVQGAAAWDAVVELRGGLQVPARLLPLARMTEVVLHHVDLDVGYEIEQVDETTAAWLLEYSAFRLRHRDEFPRLELTSDTGLHIAVGSSGPPARVTGTSQRLLGWLTGRSAPDAVQGTGGLVLPSF